MLDDDFPYEFFCVKANADQWADQVAADVQVNGEGHDFADARAWKIRNRLITIYQQFYAGGKSKGERKHID